MILFQWTTRSKKVWLTFRPLSFARLLLFFTFFSPLTCWSVSHSLLHPYPHLVPVAAFNASLSTVCCCVHCFVGAAVVISYLSPSISAAYSHVVENTAFFGDVALRFPRIVHHYYDRNSDWGGLLRWGLNFCNQTGVFTGGAHQHVLTLVRPDNEMLCLCLCCNRFYLTTAVFCNKGEKQKKLSFELTARVLLAVCIKHEWDLAFSRSKHKRGNGSCFLNEASENVRSKR